MSEAENTSIVQQGYEKFGSGDITGLLELFAEDIRWETPIVQNAAHRGERTGKNAVAGFFTELNDNEDFSRFEPREFIAQGDKVVVLGESAATIRSTGNTLETEWVHIFRLRDGKIIDFKEFFDSAAATKAYQKAATA